MKPPPGFTLREAVASKCNHGPMKLNASPGEPSEAPKRRWNPGQEWRPGPENRDSQHMLNQSRWSFLRIPVQKLMWSHRRTAPGHGPSPPVRFRIPHDLTMELQLPCKNGTHSTCFYSTMGLMGRNFLTPGHLSVRSGMSAGHSDQTIRKENLFPECQVVRHSDMYRRRGSMPRSCWTVTPDELLHWNPHHCRQVFHSFELSSRGELFLKRWFVPWSDKRL